MHREIMKLNRVVNGHRQEVDHINMNRLDNRKTNLRVCTPSLNRGNKRMQSNNRSGFKGISPADCKSKPWKAQIQLNGVYQHLGLYATPVEAARAYDKAALEVFGEFAHTNFPKEDYVQKPSS